MDIAALGDGTSRWLAAFRRTLDEWRTAEALKEVALAANLGEWTRLLTGCVVRACEGVGWRAAAKWHSLDLLPKAGQEYLGIDVMAFPSQMTSTGCWPLPLAVFELENAKGREAYSLWKVICVRAALRGEGCRHRSRAGRVWPTVAGRDRLDGTRFE